MDLIGVKKRITKLRGSLTKKEFCDKAGINASYLSQIENLSDPQKPSIEALFSIGNFCKVSVDYILTGQNYNSRGLALNQSFVGMNFLTNTDLARSMFTSLQEIAEGIKAFDAVAIDYEKVKDLEERADSLRMVKDTKNAPTQIRTERSVKTA